MDKKYRVLYWDVRERDKDIITTTIDHYADAYNFAFNRGGVVLEEVVSFVSLYDEGLEEE
jgi:hypothetical protein